MNNSRINVNIVNNPQQPWTASEEKKSSHKWNAISTNVRLTAIPEETQNSQKTTTNIEEKDVDKIPYESLEIYFPPDIGLKAEYDKKKSPRDKLQYYTNISNANNLNDILKETNDSTTDSKPLLLQNDIQDYLILLTDERIDNIFQQIISEVLVDIDTANKGLEFIKNRPVVLRDDTKNERTASILLCEMIEKSVINSGRYNDFLGILTKLNLPHICKSLGKLINKKLEEQQQDQATAGILETKKPNTQELPQNIDTTTNKEKLITYFISKKYSAKNIVMMAQNLGFNDFVWEQIYAQKNINFDVVVNLFLDYVKEHNKFASLMVEINKINIIKTTNSLQNKDYFQCVFNICCECLSLDDIDNLHCMLFNKIPSYPKKYRHSEAVKIYLTLQLVKDANKIDSFMKELSVIDKEYIADVIQEKSNASKIQEKTTKPIKALQDDLNRPQMYDIFWDIDSDSLALWYLWLFPDKVTQAMSDPDFSVTHVEFVNEILANDKMKDLLELVSDESFYEYSYQVRDALLTDASHH